MSTLKFWGLKCVRKEEELKREIEKEPGFGEGFKRMMMTKILLGYNENNDDIVLK